MCKEEFLSITPAALSIFSKTKFGHPVRVRVRVMASGFFFGILTLKETFSVTVVFRELPVHSDNNNNRKLFGKTI
jgi:hypothetical protein